MSQRFLIQRTRFQRSAQRISQDDRFLVSKTGWAIRILYVIGAGIVVSHLVRLGLEAGNLFILLSSMLPVQVIAYTAAGWFLFKSPAKGVAGNDLVTVIVPIFNQKSMIEMVMDAIFQSAYENLEVIAVNDGSTDGTKEVLDSISKKYSRLRVIHKKNEGKRRAMAAAFYMSRGKFMVLIDSDSIIEEHAIGELVKTFNADRKIGAIVGHAKVWNSEKNVLTKCQDVWYDYSFNIRKATESKFGSVLCCSGCLAAYRREAIVHYIPFWRMSRLRDSEDRELTSYIILPRLGKLMMESMAQYDDAEDRGLTAQALIDWKAVYVPTAVIYTDVPERFGVFLKQQKRWKKGTTRVNFFVGAFFWRKNPIMALLFYIDFMLTFITPMIVLTVFFYSPFVLHNLWVPSTFLVGSLLTSFIHGLDYKFRDPTAKNWMYKPLMNLMTCFLLSWLIFPALWNYKKNEWGTR